MPPATAANPSVDRPVAVNKAVGSASAQELASVRELIRREAAAVAATADAVDESVVHAARWTAACEGSVIVTGIGKAGWVGQKAAATLASTGTPAHFLHPAEAVHGDLGRVRPCDLVWAISNSGRSEELTRIIEPIRRQSAALVSFTAARDNPLADAAAIAVTYGRHREIDPADLAPTASTAAMMAVADAVAIDASRRRKFDRDDFAAFHPGGSLGRRLSTAAMVMRPIGDCRVARPDVTVRHAVAVRGSTGRRTGAVIVVDACGRLSGIFTDSDLARLLADADGDVLDRPLGDVMTSPCRFVDASTRMPDIQRVLAEHRLSELPVVDGGPSDPRVVGMIDITDLVGDQPPAVRWRVVTADRNGSTRDGSVAA